MRLADHRQAFVEIYRLDGWGGGGRRYFSGDGSHDPRLVEPYVNAARHFLQSLPDKPDVVDLGCGDFNVGSQLRQYCAGYVACDVVPKLIQHNRAVFAAVDVDFRCVDIVREQLPAGTVVFVRQVLQHLSNGHILEVSGKLRNYQYVVITDHQPAGEFVPNMDIPTGVNLRLPADSAVDLAAAPFNLDPVEQRELVRVDHPDNRGVLVTTLYRMF